MSHTDEPDRADKIEQFKSEITEEWQSPAVVSAYRKWSEEEATWGEATKQLIVERARVEPGMTVLDLASGHGEPALDLARAVEPRGHVTATDVGPGLLEIAEERAEKQGVTNLTFRVADAHDLPFPDGTFDRVTCRLGAMYFADPSRAFQEARRVLQPGGLATYLVWGPREQRFFDVMVGILFRYVEPPESDPEAPSIFAFAQSGTLCAALEAAGFREVQEESLTVPSSIPAPPQRYWQWFVDMAPPFTPLIESLDPDDRHRMEAEVIGELERFYDGQRVNIPIEVIISSGVREQTGK